MTEIIKSISIDNMLVQHQGALERIAQAAQLLLEADGMLQRAGFSSLDRVFRARRDTAVLSLNFEDLAPARQAIAASGWKKLMADSGLYGLMDATAREQWDQQITEKRVPDFNADNIRSTFAAIHEKRAEFFERGVLTLFQGLSWDHRTNKPFLLGPKLILKNALSDKGNAADGVADRLDDLLRALHVLDHKPEPEHRRGACYLGSEALARPGPKPGWENDYLRVRYFRTAKTGHVQIKRPDLVEQLNRIIARHYPHALAMEP